MPLSIAAPIAVAVLVELPVTMPAALLYVQQGTGARLANRVRSDKLRVVLMVVIAGMAAFMAYKAWR